MAGRNTVARLSFRRTLRSPANTAMTILVSRRMSPGMDVHLLATFFDRFAHPCEVVAENGASEADQLVARHAPGSRRRERAGEIEDAALLGGRQIAHELKQLSVIILLAHPFSP